MTKLLLRLFVKDHAKKEEPAVRAKVGRLSGIVGIVCNAILCAGKLVIGTVSGSVSITADAMNNLTDAASSVVTLVGFKLAERPADADHPYGHARYEYLSGLAVAVFILVSAVNMGKETISPLLGEAASPELSKLIADVMEAEPRVLGFHDLMLHDYGPGQRFGSLHVEMDQREDPLSCHELIDDMERLCLEKYNIHLVIHYDPVIVGDPEQDSLRAVIFETLQQIDARLNLHDFRLVRGAHHTNLIFDIALPADMTGREKEIGKAIDEALADRGDNMKYYTVITFDAEAFNRTI